MSGSMTGGVDASIPLSAGRGVQQTDPLEQIGRFAGIQNALNSAKMFPGALALQGGQQQLQQQAIQGGGVDLQTRMNQAAAGLATPLLALPAGGINHGNLTDTLASIEKNYNIPTNGILAHVLRMGPQGDGPEFDAAARAAIAAYAQPAAGAAAAVTPHAGPMLDVGPTLQPTTVTPQGSPTPGVMVPVGGSYGKGLSPGEATSPTQIGTTAAGAPVVGTRQQFIDATGGASPLGTGRLPPALRGPNASAPGVVTGVGPAQQSQMAAQGSASAAAFQDIANQGVQARGQNAVLGNMLGDIANFTPGPEKLNQYKMTLQRYAPSIASTFGLDPASIAANESFDKLANQIAGAQGERSDARLAVAQQANPGSHLSPAGADLIIRQLQGNSDYLQARAKLAAQYPNQTDRAGFENQVRDMMDPRAFQYERMTPAQRKTYASGLSKQDLSDVRKSYNQLHSEGLIGGN